MKKRLFFRVDASKKIGRGHLSRCVAVAEMLQSNFDISFITLKDNEAFVNRLNIKFTQCSISEEDEIFNIISNKDFVWLDGYQFSENYKKQLQQQVFKLIETNDIPYEAKNVDVIFNHSPGVEASYFGKTTAQLGLGLDYALLRQSFLEYAKAHSKSPKGKGVFICFGGADTFNLGYKFVQKLIAKNFIDPIYWITAQKNKNLELPQNVEVLSNLDNFQMIDYMLKSKVLLIPSSVLSFEGIALRKPIFTGYFVDNQKLIFESLKKAKLAECFGYLETDEDVDIALTPFFNFYHNIEKQKRIAEVQSQMIDCNSKKRILNILEC
jgi:spore coat polysaccharide biosynthesis predicted glycosyltransferase SpsG